MTKLAHVGVITNPTGPARSAGSAGFVVGRGRHLGNDHPWETLGQFEHMDQGTDGIRPSSRLRPETAKESTMPTKQRLVRLATASALAVGSVASTSTAAHAATAYKVSGTDGTLAEQSQPATGHIVGRLHEGDTVQVVCQINNGGQDIGDGGTFPWQQSRTWDHLTSGDWDYGDGHVAVVVKVDSSSYTVAEFNFNLGGGGQHIMSFRRIPWPDPYPNSLGGPSVLAFIR